MTPAGRAFVILRLARSTSEEALRQAWGTLGIDAK